ncbi:VOC family protein, partial [Luedemannella flava]|uniref:VOC family protein n=1 Tax=Luedemannella flava TaxID=349316 RepID=UPI0031E41E69
PATGTARVVERPAPVDEVAEPAEPRAASPWADDAGGPVRGTASIPRHDPNLPRFAETDDALWAPPEPGPEPAPDPFDAHADQATRLVDEPRPATATVEPVDEPLPRRVPRQRDESQFPSAEVIVGEVLNQRTAVGQTVHGVGTKLYVADIDRSRRFYREVMGFTEVAAAGGRAEFSFPGGRVLLSRVAENPVPARNLRRLLLDVTDIAAVYHDLEREGVACRSRPHRSGGDGRSEIWVATLEDPDGNIIELNEPIAFGSRTP